MKDAKTTEDYIKKVDGFYVADVDIQKIRDENPLQCEKCGFLIFDDASVCPACGSKDNLTTTIVDPIIYTNLYHPISGEIVEIIYLVFRNRSDVHVTEKWHFMEKLLKEHYHIIYHNPTYFNPYTLFD